MANAIEFLDEWNAQDVLHRVSINISPEELLHTEFISTLEKFCDHLPISCAEQITLELRSHDFSHQLPEIAKILSSCRDMGLGLVLDNFTVAYPCVNLLRNVPATGVKIHRQLLSQFSFNSEKMQAVRNILSLCKQLGKTICAVGIADSEQAEVLSEWGCDFLQGNSIAEPMPARQLIPWLSSNYALVRATTS